MIPQDDFDNLKSINNKLLPFDWIISPYYSGLEISVLKKFSSGLPTSPTKEQKKQISHLISSIIIKGNLNYHFRAIVVYEGYRITPNMSKYSHLYEAGLIEFYKLNFISCLGIWIPIIEGLIRSFLGVTFTRNLNKDDLKDLRAKQAEYQPFLDLIIDNLLIFFNNTFFKSVGELDDLSTNNLNRHFFSHAISNEPMYCRNNCLRLINVFDTFLAIDFIVDDHFKALFDGTDPLVKKRELYYLEVVKSAFSDLEIYRLELLKQHKHFDEEFYFGKFS